MDSFIRNLAGRAKDVEERAAMYCLAHRLCADWQREASTALVVLGILAASFTAFDRKGLGIALIVATVVVGVTAVVARGKDHEEDRERHALASTAYLALYHQACNCYWRIVNQCEDEQRLQASLQELLASSQETLQTAKVWPGVASLSAAWLATKISQLFRYWRSLREAKERDSGSPEGTPTSCMPGSVAQVQGIASGNVRIDRLTSVLVGFDTTSTLTGALSINVSEEAVIPAAPSACVAFTTSTDVAGDQQAL